MSVLPVSDTPENMANYFCLEFYIDSNGNIMDFKLKGRVRDIRSATEEEKQMWEQLHTIFLTECVLPE